MATISDMSAINADDNVNADVVSNNFSQIEVAINSNALDSTNYGLSAILASHIATKAILSQHLSDSAVAANKINTLAIVHGKVNYASSDNGVRVLQVGSISSNMPANGVFGARVSETIAITTDDQPFTHHFSKSPEGDPGFTATPIINGTPLVQFSNSTDIAPTSVIISAMDSKSCKALYNFSATQNATATVHFGVWGVK